MCTSIMASVKFDHLIVQMSAENYEVENVRLIYKYASEMLLCLDSKLAAHVKHSIAVKVQFV